MHDDIMYYILSFARENGGVFKNSSFNYIADPPKGWIARRDLLEYMTSLGYFEKFKVNRIYMYRLTEKGRHYLGE